MSRTVEIKRSVVHRPNLSLRERFNPRGPLDLGPISLQEGIEAILEADHARAAGWRGSRSTLAARYSSGRNVLGDCNAPRGRSSPSTVQERRQMLRGGDYILMRIKDTELALFWRIEPGLIVKSS